MSLDYLPHYQWVALLGAAMLFWAWQWVRPRYGVPAASLLGFLSLSSIWVWVFVENRYMPINPYDQTALRYFAADSLARMMVVLVPMMALAENKRAFLTLGEFLTLSFVTMNSLFVVVGGILGLCFRGECGGAGNASIMVGLTVCTLPILIKSWKHQYPLLILVTLAVFFSKSSIAAGLFSLFLGYSFVRRFPRLLWFSAVVSAVPILVGYLYVGREFFSSSDRFHLWGSIMPMWAAPWNIPMGTGWGTFHVMVLDLQLAKDLASGFHWSTMHNDWLQMLFEGGAVGILLMLATYIHALWRMVGEWNFFASILLYGIYMAVNPALHHAIPALFGAWIFLYALKRQPNKYEGEALCLS